MADTIELRQDATAAISVGSPWLQEVVSYRSRDTVRGHPRGRLVERCAAEDLPPILAITTAGVRKMGVLWRSEVRRVGV